MANLKHVLSLGKKLRGLFDKEWPQVMDVQLDVSTEGAIHLSFHQVGDYQNGIEMMRLLGIKTWNKTTCRPEDPFTCLSAQITEAEQRIYVNMYCQGLPPTCKIETKMEKVPKSQIVDTGEFIEIPIRKIVCGT